MFLAIIRVRPDPMALSATLGPLVRGVIEGMVGSAILVADMATPELETIADAAGCRVLVAPTWPEGFARAIAGSAGAPVIVLDTGVMLGHEFWPLLADHLPMLGDRAAVTAFTPSGFLAGVIAWFRPSLSLDQALIFPGSRARQIAMAGTDPWKSAEMRDALALPSRARRIAP